MCGIVGIYNYSNTNVDEKVLLKMRDTLNHRGPDGYGIMIKKNIGLAHRRLSIIDITKNGRQPMSNLEKTIWITFNGEFYNFKQHKIDLERKGYKFKSNTDTEVIIYLYQEYGIDETLKKMNGMFAFTIWDETLNKLFICRDRLGIKPLFYSNNNERFIFASEMKAIVVSGYISKEINKQAIYDYFSLKFIPAPNTAFSEISKLEPGHYITVEKKQITLKEYWKLNVSKFHSDSEKKQILKIENKFKESVRKRMISDVPIGAFLSGGVDSSGVVAMMSQFNKKIKTYSIGLSEYDDYDETKYAKIVSEKYSTEHKKFDLTSNLFNKFVECMEFFDEPFAISSGFALYYLSALTKKDVSVVLSGDGGDEIFAGYSTKFGRDKLLYNLRFLPKFIPKYAKYCFAFYNRITNNTSNKGISFQRFFDYLSTSTDEAYIKSISVFTEKEKDILFSNQFLKGQKIKPTLHVFERHYQKQKFNDYLQRRTYGEIKTQLPDEMLTKVDRMAMASSVESRTPLLDHTFVEYVFNINSKYKLYNRSNGKMIFKKSLEKYLPKNILYRKKSGFSIPIDYWFKNQLKGFVDEILSEKIIIKQGIFNVTYVNLVKEKFYKGKTLGLHSEIYDNIMLLVVFQIWYNKHVE
jgi:asparagine synthase (glutamine-hydrolysing)